MDSSNKLDSIFEQLMRWISHWNVAVVLRHHILQLSIHFIAKLNPLQPLFHRMKLRVCSDFGCELPPPPLCDCLHYNPERQNCINQPSYSLPASRAKCDGAALLFLCARPGGSCVKLWLLASPSLAKAAVTTHQRCTFLRLSSRFACVYVPRVLRGERQARFEVTSNWIDAAMPLLLKRWRNIHIEISTWCILQFFRWRQKVSTFVLLRKK